MSRFTLWALEPRRLLAASYGHGGIVTLPLPTAVLDSVFRIDTSRVLLTTFQSEYDKTHVISRVDRLGVPDATFGKRGQLAVPSDFDVLAVDRHDRTLLGDGTGLWLLNADGSPNRTFNRGYALHPTYNGNEFTIDHAAFANDGGLIVTGQAAGADGEKASVLLRLDKTGHARGGFGTNGFVTLVTDTYSGGDDSSDSGQHTVQAIVESRDGSVYVPLIYRQRYYQVGALTSDTTLLHLDVVRPDGTLDPNSSDALADFDYRTAVNPNTKVYYAGLNRDGRLVVEATNERRVQRFVYGGTELAYARTSDAIDGFTPGDVQHTDNPLAAMRTADGSTLVYTGATLRRLHPDLTPDAAWGVGGILDYPFSVYVNDFSSPLPSILPDGDGVLRVGTAVDGYQQVGKLRIIRTDATSPLAGVKKGTAIQTDTTLAVHGTRAADTIDVIRRKAGINVTLNGKSLGTFSGVTRVVVDADNGNDTVTLTRVPSAEVLGGGGNDSITATLSRSLSDANEGVARLFGQDGSDTITLHTLADNEEYLFYPRTRLDGGRGDDTLTGDAADDAIFGGSGRDVLSGRGGSDTLNGDSGDDRLDGGTERDRLEAGGGSNTLIGGDGEDTFLPGPGKATVSGGRGTDSMQVNDYDNDRLPDDVEWYYFETTLV